MVGAWHLLALVWLLAVPAQLRLGPFWRLGEELRPFLLGLVLAYAVCAVVLLWAGRRERRIPFQTLVLSAAPVLAAYLLFLVLTEPTIPRSVLLGTLPIVFVFLWWSTRARPRQLLLSLVMVGATASVAIAVPLLDPEPDPLLGETVVFETAHETLAVTHYVDRFGAIAASGGAIAPFGDRTLLATGDGRLFLLDLDHVQRRLQTTALTGTVPLNQDDFRTALAGLPDYLARWFRVADIVIQDRGESFRLFASHFFWKRSEECSVIRISAFEGKYRDVLSGTAPSPHWKTLFETTPCLPLTIPDPTNTNDHAFAGHFGGGQMAFLDESHLLLSLGDLGFDGVYDPVVLAQDPTASQGKTILLDLDSGTPTTFTIGHRSPLGLLVTRKGEIWLTENGPEGGDELNLLRQGANYGWPYATFGTDYGKMDWPLVPNVGRHIGYELPVYSWLPSIGISSLVKLEGDMFPAWTGDLMIASLKAQALWRTRVEEGRVVFVERIGAGRRVRDLIEGPDGGLVLWEEYEEEGELRGAITTIRTASESGEGVSRGELLYTTCTACHVSEGGGEAGIAPPLEGVFDRRFADVDGFAYSSALRRLEGRWNEEALDGFLANPQAFAPGTMMTFPGIADSGDRAALIRHLRTLR